MDAAIDYVRALAWPTLALVIVITASRIIGRIFIRPADRSAFNAGICRDGNVNSSDVAAALEDSDWISSLVNNSPPSPDVRLKESVHIAPVNYREAAKKILEALRSQRSVLLDLASTEGRTAARTIDFSSAVTLSAGGSVQRLTSTVLLLTPSVD